VVGAQTPTETNKKEDDPMADDHDGDAGNRDNNSLGRA
jgi:hypothetical protein